MYFLKWNGQQQLLGILNFTFVNQKLHLPFEDPFVLQRSYFIKPLLPFRKRLSAQNAQYPVPFDNHLRMQLKPRLTNRFQGCCRVPGIPFRLVKPRQQGFSYADL